MNITVMGAGNSGLAMAAHLGQEGHKVVLWNRSESTIAKLKDTKKIHCEGAISGQVEIDLVTNDIEKAVENPDIILITSPASSHKELGELIGKNIKRETLIVLNPGRTFGALEFKNAYKKYNNEYEATIAEAQTIIYTCRKTSEDSVNIISMKNNVLISTFNSDKNKEIIERLPKCISQYFKPAKSMIETSIGNVGMVLHCAPLLLNTGWTETHLYPYMYYYDGITPSIGKLMEKIDDERLRVAKALGADIISTKDWLKRTYNVEGDSLYECIQNNDAYRKIDAPKSLKHRYIFEDIPCGLVPLEAIGKKLGLEMTNTSLIIDLASALLNNDFRSQGRRLETLSYDKDIDFTSFLKGRDFNGRI